MADDDRARWTKLVSDFESSDLTQREYAQERGLSLGLFRYWLYKLRKESRPLVAEAPGSSGQAPEPAPRRKDSILVPVRVVASAPKARPAEAPPGLLELALPSGACLRFPAGTDLEYLRRLAAAL